MSLALSPEVLRQKSEPFDMGRADHLEMPVIETGNLGVSEPFGCGNHERVGAAERQIGVTLDEVRSPAQILVGWNLHVVPLLGQGSEEGSLDRRSELLADEVERLPQDRCRDEQGRRRLAE